MLEGVLRFMGDPFPRESRGSPVPIDHQGFSGFIFKIQANMDPKHRDIVAFVRVCSGRFCRSLKVHHFPSGRTVSLRNARLLFGRSRRALEEAYAGDVVGIIGHHEFGIGDTLSEDPQILYAEVPTFSPEVFAVISNPHPWNAKRFEHGIKQLLLEGAIQTIKLADMSVHCRLLAAVGPLQFEVTQYRLRSEFGVETTLGPSSWFCMRWLDRAIDVDDIELPSLIEQAVDQYGNPVLLYKSARVLDQFHRDHPEVHVEKQPFAAYRGSIRQSSFSCPNDF